MNDVTKSSELVDEYASTREQRLALARQVDKLDEKEKQLKAQLIAMLEATGATAIGGKLMIVTLVPKEKAVAKDWDAIHRYIIENDGWDIMQKRLTETAIKLRWEEGIAIPGVEKFPVNDLSISKR